MIGRRAFLASASAIALVAPCWNRAHATTERIKVRPVPLSSVRLTPSIWANSVETNRKALLALSPERLLHNFYLSAGLPTRGEQYGGWEARGIAGHTLGHYLSACALMVAQTGDAAVRARLEHTVAECARIQAAHGDGYLGGTTVDREGETLDGKIVFEEIRQGDVRSGGFDVNGGWVPLYTWHKVHAGLIDAERYGAIAAARPVMLALAGYLATILEGLDDATLQRLLAAEYGGLNDSYAETYALTADPRWLRLAERIRDRKILDPLAQGQNVLPGLHANTQIPKVIGLARLYELTGDPRHADAARFFHTTVTNRHSYVIGGNSNGEHFGEPGRIAGAITERTCEACNSYNMLKLTRHLYGWDGQAAAFDYYERTHLNHILAHQHPGSGAFVYFMPLGAGARRTYSTPEDSFWCCVGSGLESHAKHGESIWWHDGTALRVNLFIPSQLDWEGNRVALATRYPFGESVTLTIDSLDRPLALRIPGWCIDPDITINDEQAAFDRRGGYAYLDRAWRKGDRVVMTLPMTVRVESPPDDPRTVAYLYGPLVLAADLGPADQPFDQLAPVLITSDPLATIRPVDAAKVRFAVADAKPEALTLVPFFAQYDRRTAVYFPQFTPAEWTTEEAAFAKAQRAAALLEKRTVDQISLGEMQPERDHDYASNHSDLFSMAGRSARQLPWGEGNWLEFTMTVRDAPVSLRLLYWGEETNKDFDIAVEGRRIARERRQTPSSRAFTAVEYPIPPALTADKDHVRVRVETRGSDALIYEARTVEAAQ